jgi:hypothetical protein
MSWQLLKFPNVDADLIALCEEFLKTDRLKLACDTSPDDVSEQLAGEISARWRRLLAQVADIQAHTDTGRRAKLEVFLAVAGRACQRRRVEDVMLSRISRDACPATPPEQLADLVDRLPPGLSLI